jgi:pimeloyl-ACP methyl ester carboxylesterase
LQQKRQWHARATAVIVAWRSPELGLDQPREAQISILGPRGFIRLAYIEWGPVRSERTVVCVHGLTRNGRDFDPLARALAGKGCRVVCPDLPGRGRSEWLKRTVDYDTALYLSALTAVIARLGAEQVDWVGTSFGGFIGMEMAAKSNSPVRKLVLNDFGGRVPAAALRRISNHAGQNPKFRDLLELETYLRDVLAPFGALTDAQWRHLAKHSALQTADGSLRLNHDPAITLPFLWPFIIDVPLWHTWDAINCPVLVIRGAFSDFLTSDTMREMQRRGLAAKRELVQVAEFADCGHAPALMSKEQIDVVANFLLA